MTAPFYGRSAHHSVAVPEPADELAAFDFMVSFLASRWVAKKRIFWRVPDKAFVLPRGERFKKLAYQYIVADVSFQVVGERRFASAHSLDVSCMISEDSQAVSTSSRDIYCLHHGTLSTWSCMGSMVPNYRGRSGALVSKNDMGQDLTSLPANRAFSRENCLHNGRRSTSALSARLMSAYTMY